MLHDTAYILYKSMGGESNILSAVHLFCNAPSVSSENWCHV